MSLFSLPSERLNCVNCSAQCISHSTPLAHHSFRYFSSAVESQARCRTTITRLPNDCTLIPQSRFSASSEWSANSKNWLSIFSFVTVLFSFLFLMWITIWWFPLWLTWATRRWRVCSEAVGHLKVNASVIKNEDNINEEDNLKNKYDLIYENELKN